MSGGEAVEVQPVQQLTQPGHGSVLLKSVFSRLTDAARTLSRRVIDLVQGHGSLSQSHAWMMGVLYGQQQDQDNQEPGLSLQDKEALLLDFHSRIWCTYRRDFVPLGPDGLTSDVGWGCTIRSGQMMMAEVLLRHVLGRSWRQHLRPGPSPHNAHTPPHTSSSTVTLGEGDAAALSTVLSAFMDDPGAPLSIHRICEAGKPGGVMPGRWLGPWALCRALCTLIATTQPKIGVTLHMVCDPGGGAPTLDPDQLLSLLPPEDEASAQGSTEPQQPAGTENGVHHSADVHSGEVQGTTDAIGSLSGPAEPGVTDGEPAGKAANSAPPHNGLVLLLPLTLGVGKTNPVYFPQLLRVLEFPQTVGIVGGRPSASLFFLGHQDDQLLYLDPHIPQPAAPLPSALPSYFCNIIRLMPITSIDPSLAIGFYCRTRGELLDLVGRLDVLALEHRRAPIVTLATSGGSAQRDSAWIPSAPPAGWPLAGPDDDTDQQEWEVL